MAVTKGRSDFQGPFKLQASSVTPYKGDWPKKPGRHPFGGARTGLGNVAFWGSFGSFGGERPYFPSPSSPPKRDGDLVFSASPLCMVSHKRPAT